MNNHDALNTQTVAKAQRGWRKPWASCLLLFLLITSYVGSFYGFRKCTHLCFGLPVSLSQTSGG